MKKSLKGILIIVLILVAIGGFIGYKMYNKAPEKVEDVEGTAVTAAVLTQEYSQNETAANQKYLNKALDVAGTVTEINKNQDGATVVTLSGGDQAMAIQCTMRDKDIKLESGKAITLKGFCSGNTMFDVLLTDCVVK